MPAEHPKTAYLRLLWFLTAILVLIGIAIVIWRLLFLFAPSATPAFPEQAALNTGFAQHRLLTAIHIVPGLVFVVLAPLQFVRRLRTQKPVVHRWMGRTVVISGMITGITALIMSPQMAIGGINETAATMLFAVLFLICLARAFLCIRRGRIALHREWMIRAFAIGLAVATIRPIMGVFFATRALTHLTPHDFFGTAFWLGFTVQAIVAESWINYTRPRITGERRSSTKNAGASFILRA